MDYPIDTSFWRTLILRYANGRKVCSCEDAYYKESKFQGHDYTYCEHGCTTNKLLTKNEIAKKVLEELAEKDRVIVELEKKVSLAT
jgi:hypothetical protein